MGRIRDLWTALSYREYASADHLWRRRVRTGEINERFKRRVWSSTDQGYNRFPFLTDPFYSRRKHHFYKTEESVYEYTEHGAEGFQRRRNWADKTFAAMYDLVKDRVDPSATLFDVGCSAGYQLDNFHKRGFTNLWGIDPNPEAIALGRTLRPHINFVEGFFGPKENDIRCDLMTWFDTIYRIPYEARLFDAIDRCVDKHVLITTQEALNDLYRDLHVGLGSKGFVCIEKRTYTEDDKNRLSETDFAPFGTEGADGEMVVLGNRTNAQETRRLFRSFMLFRRIEPR